MIQIKRQRPHVEALLAPYEAVIGKDFRAYRNHVYRTITYAMHFLHHDSEQEKLVETVFVYHDIGLWTDRELAYLASSEALAIQDNEKYGWGLEADALVGAIHWHHKLRPYRGPHERVIEACRKADWVDVSMGVLRKGLAKSEVRAVEEAFPNLGFHSTLLRLAKDLGGSTLRGGIRVTRGIVKW